VSTNRRYTSRRYLIVQALVEKLKEIDGTGDYSVNLAGNVQPRLLFWDEINEFPAVHVTAGNEQREYQGGGYKDRFLSVTVRCYVKSEDATAELEGLLGDIEFVIEENGRLAYQDRLGPQSTHDITIRSIDTDEGVLDPLGVGEILLQVRY
jgi:hypothetical protein